MLKWDESRSDDTECSDYRSYSIFVFGLAASAGFSSSTATSAASAACMGVDCFLDGVFYLELSLSVVIESMNDFIESFSSSS